MEALVAAAVAGAEKELAGLRSAREDGVGARTAVRSETATGHFRDTACSLPVPLHFSPLPSPRFHCVSLSVRRLLSPFLPSKALVGELALALARAKALEAEVTLFTVF